MLFGKKKKTETTVLLPAESVILQDMETKQAVTEYERQFFLAFEDELRLNGIDPKTVTATRMGNGCIRCSVSAGIVGTVHLRKQFGSIQYFIDPLKIHNMQDAPVEAVVAVAPYWVAYLCGLLHLHRAAITP